MWIMIILTPFISRLSFSIRDQGYCLELFLSVYKIWDFHSRDLLGSSLRNNLFERNRNGQRFKLNCDATATEGSAQPPRSSGVLPPVKEARHVLPPSSTTTNKLVKQNGRHKPNHIKIKLNVHGLNITIKRQTLRD